MEPDPVGRRDQLQHFYEDLPIPIRNKIEKKIHELWKKDTLELFLIRAAQCRDIVKSEFGDYGVGFRREATKAILLKMQEKDRLAAETAFESIKALLDAESSDEEEDEGDDEKEEGELDDDEEEREKQEAAKKLIKEKVEGKELAVALGEILREKEFIVHLEGKEGEKKGGKKNVEEQMELVVELGGKDKEDDKGGENDGEDKTEEDGGNKDREEMIFEIEVEGKVGEEEGEKEGNKVGGEIMIRLVEGHVEELGEEDSDEEDGWNYGYEEMREYTDSDFEELEAYYRERFMS